MSEMKNVTETTDLSFASEVLSSELPAVVDFWAPWCGPCQMMGPVFETVAGRFEGQARFFKLNTDESPKTPGQYRLMAIPTLIVFQKGREVRRWIGVVPQNELEAGLQTILEEEKAQAARASTSPVEGCAVEPPKEK
jgi:thioredoxin 1